MLGVFLDTEANGLNFLIHHPIEIAFKIVDLYTKRVVSSYEAVLGMEKEEWDLSDPESLKVCEMTWQQVCNGISREAAGKEIVRHFQNAGVKRKEAVFICQNPSFDRAYFAQLVPQEQQEALSWPYHWLDLASMYWAISMKNGRLLAENEITKNKIAAAYGLPPEAKPHRAMNGVDHLILCYEAVVG